MKIITHNITLDVASPHARGRMFEVKRKDGGTHTINFTLTENGTAISEYDGVTSYRIRVLHMDKSSTETEYTDFAGTIKHTLSAADLGVFGDALCEVSLYDDSGSRLTSAAFGFFIVPDINTDEGVLNDSNYPVLDNLIKTVNENLSGVESMTKKANDLITKAETVGSNASNLEEALQTINNNVNAKANEVKSNSDRAETAADSANSAMSRAETAANSSETEASKAQSAKNNADTAQRAAEFARNKAETAADNAIAAKTAAEAAKTDVEAYMESDKFHTHDNKAWLDKLVYLDAYPTYEGGIAPQLISEVDCSVFDNMQPDICYCIDVKSEEMWNALKANAMTNSNFKKTYPKPTYTNGCRAGYRIFMFCELFNGLANSPDAIQYFIEPNGKVYSRTITKTISGVSGENVSYTYADFKRIDGEDKVDKVEGKGLIDTDVADNISIKNYGTNDVFTVATPEVDFKFVNAETINILTADDIHWGTNTTLQTELDKKVDKASDKLLTETQKEAIDNLGYQDPVGTIPQGSYGGYNVSDYINIINSGMIQGRTGEGFSFIRDKDLNTLQDVLKNKVDNDATKTLISKNIASLIEYSEENGNQYLTFDTDVVKIPGVANISYLKVPSAMDIILTGNGNQELGNYINDQIIDGTANLVADTQYASGTQAGVVKVDSIKGIKVDESGEIGLNVPNETAIAQRLPANSNLPITIGNLDYAVRSVRPTKSNSLPNTLAVNTIYDLLKEQTVTLNLPSSAEYGDFIQVDIYSGETPTNLTITCPGGSLSDIDLIPEANTMYSLYFDFGTMYVSEKNDSGAIAIDIGWRFSYAAYPHEEV